jgi:xylose isomerase
MTILEPLRAGSAPAPDGGGAPSHTPVRKDRFGSGHEQMAALNVSHGISQAPRHGKVFHFDPNGRHGVTYDQNLRFGTGDVKAGDVMAGDVPLHFDFEPPPTEDRSGGWTSAAGRMRNHVILKEKSAAWRTDPQVREAMAVSRVDQLRTPTLAPAESVADLMAEELDVAVTARRGFHDKRLDQLALHGLLGVRR